MCCSLALANVLPSAKETTTGAMRARTEVVGRMCKKTFRFFNVLLADVRKLEENVSR
jgi:hypothetical protein